MKQIRTVVKIAWPVRRVKFLSVYGVQNLYTDIQLIFNHCIISYCKIIYKHLHTSTVDYLSYLHRYLHRHHDVLIHLLIVGICDEHVVAGNRQAGLNSHEKLLCLNSSLESEEI